MVIVNLLIFAANNNNSASFKFKTKIAGRIKENNNKKNVKIRVLLKFLNIFWRTLEMLLINCEINLILTWSNKCFIIDSPAAGQEPTFTMTHTKLYVPVVTLLSQANVKLLEKLRLGFKRTINWNKYEPKVTIQKQNRYLNLLINPSFQGVNTLFVLSFEHTDGRTSYTRYYLPLVELKGYQVLIDGRNVLDQPVKNNFITYDNNRKIATRQVDDCTTSCLLDYNYFNNYFKMIAIDLSKQPAIDTDPKAI